MQTLTKTSNGELLLRQYLRLKYHWVKQEYNVRPDWLKWETGNNLELDVYIPELRLAFEFNGEHHLKDLSQKRRDICKRNKCEAAGIRLQTFSLQTLYVYAKSRKHTEGKYADWFKRLEGLLEDYRKRFPQDKTVAPTRLLPNHIPSQRPRGKRRAHQYRFNKWTKSKCKHTSRIYTEMQEHEAAANKARAIFKLFYRGEL